MGSLNKNEIGQKIRINLNEDISASTPTLFMEPEFGLLKEITAGVTIPNTNVFVNGDTFLANEYVEYTTIDGDLDYVGRWRFKAKLAFASNDVRQTDYVKFRVLP